MSLLLLYWILIVVMVVGVVGSVVPLIPGPSLILAAILVWEIATGFSYVGWPLVLVGITLLLSIGVELLATYWGTKQVGASSWGQVGAVVGLVLGVLGLLPALPIGGPIVGLLIGPVIGGFIGEFLYRRTLPLKDRTTLAARVSIAVVVSSLIGNILELLLAIASVVIFVLTTWNTVAALG